MATELSFYEIERLEAERDEAEKIANVSLHQRADMMKLIGRLTDALTDIGELVEGAADITDHGGPNLAMEVLAIVRTGLGKKQW